MELKELDNISRFNEVNKVKLVFTIFQLKY